MASTRQNVANQTNNTVNINDGTTCRQPSPRPGPLTAAGLGASNQIAQTTPATLFQSAPGVTSTLPILQVPFPMRLSPAGQNFIKAHEELRLFPYDDQTGKTISVWNKHATIGWGHLIYAQEWSLYAGGITPGIAQDVFDADAKISESPVNRLVRVPLTQYQFDALVDLVYNSGSGNFATSPILLLLNNPHALVTFSSLQAAWLGTSVGVSKAVQAGVRNRRLDEWKLFSTGSYT